MATKIVLIIAIISIMLFGIGFYVSNIILTKQQIEHDVKAYYDKQASDFAIEEKHKIAQMNELYNK